MDGIKKMMQSTNLENAFLTGVNLAQLRGLLKTDS